MHALHEGRGLSGWQPSLFAGYPELGAWLRWRYILRSECSRSSRCPRPRTDWRSRGFSCFTPCCTLHFWPCLRNQPLVPSDAGHRTPCPRSWARPWFVKTGRPVYTALVLLLLPVSWKWDCWIRSPINIRYTTFFALQLADIQDMVSSYPTIWATEAKGTGSPTSAVRA